MKEEIKEILELFAFTDEDIMFGDIVELNPKQSHLLLDYITNLQEENGRLVELCNKYEEEHSTVFNLWKTQGNKWNEVEKAYLDDKPIGSEKRVNSNDLANVMGSFIETELNSFEELNKELEEKDKEIERLNKGLEYMKLYWSNREEYEKNELLSQIRDKDTSIEWLERAIEEEKKRERLH